MDVPLLLLFAMWGFQPQSRIESNLRVDYVVLNAIALSAGDFPVADLTIEDFKVFDEKREVALELFETLDFRGMETERQTYLDWGDGAGNAVYPEDSAGQDEVAQTLVLILDFGGLNQAASDEAFAHLQWFLEKIQPRRNLQLFIYSLVGGMVTQGFVEDPRAALDDLIQFESRMDQWRSQNSATQDEGLIALERAFANCFPKSLIQTEDYSRRTAPALANQCLDASLRQFSDMQKRKSEGVMGALSGVVDSLARIEGLKSLYLVSPGFSVEPGRAGISLARAYHQLADPTTAKSPFSVSTTAGRSTVRGGPADFDDFDGRFRRLEKSGGSISALSLEEESRRFGASALKNQVVFHTFGMPRNYREGRQMLALSMAGLALISVEESYLDYGLELDGGLAQLAAASGGIHRRAANLGQALENTLHSSRFYYVFGYKRPSGSKGYRQVKIQCTRPGVTLYHAGGYFPAPGKKSGRAR